MGLIHMPQRAQSHRPIGHDAIKAAAVRESDRIRNDDATRRLLKRRHYERFAKWILASRPSCEVCDRVKSTNVHHTRILRNHSEDLCDETQVQALCQSCHSKITAKGG